MFVTTGVPLVMSMTRAVFALPPNCRMRPGRNIAALESDPVGPVNWLPSVTEPDPLVST